MIIIRNVSKYQKINEEELAEKFKALSNPNRLRIFMRLTSCCTPGTPWVFGDGSCSCVGDLGKDLGIAPSTLSHHIKELRRAGLVMCRREGKTVLCWVDGAALDTLRAFFSTPAGRERRTGDD